MMPPLLESSAKCQNLALWHSAPFGTWHFGTQLRLALGTLALSSVWHLALWHSAPFGTWHFGTQLRLALGTFALSSVWDLALSHSASFGTWHVVTCEHSGDTLVGAATYVAS